MTTTPDTTTDPMRPDTPDTTSGYPVSITDPTAIIFMRQQVNSARCSVIRHHRTAHDAPVTHVPALAEELWLIIERNRGDVRIYQHHDAHPDSGDTTNTYTVVLRPSYSEAATGAASGEQMWFTTHPHPDPASRAARRDATLTEMLGHAQYIVDRYSELPRVTSVQVDQPIGGRPRIQLQIGNSYSAQTMSDFAVWAEHFDRPVVIEHRYGTFNVHVHAPAPDGGDGLIGFTVCEYMSQDRAAKVSAAFAGVDGVTVEGDPEQGLTRVPGKLFAQIWKQHQAEHPGQHGWPTTMGGQA